MAWFIPIKKKEGKGIYVQFALSVPRVYIKYTIVQKGGYRLKHFILNFS